MSDATSGGEAVGGGRAADGEGGGAASEAQAAGGGTSVGSQGVPADDPHRRPDGVDDATPAPGVLVAIDDADVVVIAPSNPIVSIGPILAVAGVREALTTRRDRVVAEDALAGSAELFKTSPCSGRADLLDVPRLASQLIGLERRTARGGRDSIDHPPGVVVVVNRSRRDAVGNAGEQKPQRHEHHHALKERLQAALGIAQKPACGNDQK